jgi:hypothetical protein
MASHCLACHPWNNSDAIDPRKGVVRDLTGTTVPADPYRWILIGDDGSGEPWNMEGAGS